MQTEHIVVSPAVLPAHTATARGALNAAVAPTSQHECPEVAKVEQRQSTTD